MGEKNESITVADRPSDTCLSSDTITGNEVVTHPSEVKYVIRTRVVSDESSMETGLSGQGELITPASHTILAIDRVPKTIWVVTIAGAAERFAYYSLAAPLQNYVQNERSGHANPGALGLGQQTATNLTNVFLLLQFLSPLPFAALADLRWGRLKTLMLSLAIYDVGCLILLLTSLPASIDYGAGLPGLVVSLILIAFGIGGIKATLPPFLVDQYSRTESRVLQARNDTVIVSDRQLTIQYITNVFFWATNIAALSSLASTWIEIKVDFWASYLMAFAFLLLAQVLMFIWRRDFVSLDPQGSNLPLTLKGLWFATKNGFSLTKASPEYQTQHFGKSVPWDDTSLQDLRQALIIGRVLLFSCPFYLAYIQIANNLISQAGQMRLDGMPNDTMQVFNPIACIMIGPIIQKGLFPLLRRLRIPFRPIARISLACFTMSLAMAYASGNQHLVYSTGPCFDRPLACPDARDGTKILGNNISVWVQTPVWFILAVAEILGFATIAEIAYELAPKSMKSLVQAVTQVTAGLATIVGIAMSPLARDPNLVILYSTIAGLTSMSAGLFWLFFKSVDRGPK